MPRGPPPAAPPNRGPRDTQKLVGTILTSPSVPMDQGYLGSRATSPRPLYGSGPFVLSCSCLHRIKVCKIHCIKVFARFSLQKQNLINFCVPLGPPPAARGPSGTQKLVRTTKPRRRRSRRRRGGGAAGEAADAAFFGDYFSRNAINFSLRR